MDQMIRGYFIRTAFWRGKYCGGTKQATRPFTSKSGSTARKTLVLKSRTEAMVADAQPLSASDRDWTAPIYEYPIQSD
jgi:hypothetical protein